MIVNVCPAAVTSASTESVWNVLTNFERFGDWNDASFVSAEPAGPVVAGQTIHLTAPALGRSWKVTVEVRDLDPGHRSLDLLIRLPFGVDNHEHITLTETDAGGALVRFN